MSDVMIAPGQSGSEERLRRVLDGMAEGFAILDHSLRIVDMNAEGLRIDGRSREDLIGLRVEEAWPESVRLPTLPAYEAALRTGEPSTFEYRHLSDQHDVWLEVRVYPVPEGLALFYRDVSERHRAADALLASEEFNRRILQSSADCIKVLDLEGRLEFLSEGGLCALEVDDFGTMRGAFWPNLWSEAERPKVLAAMNTARHGGAAHFQGFATTAKGSPRWWDVAVTPISGSDGNPEKLLSILRDITAAHRAEAALGETSRRLDAILANTRMAVFLMDDRQHCIYANPAAEQLTGYAFEEMQGRPLHDVVHHTRPDGTHYPLEECPIDRAFPERAHMEGEELFVARDGSFYPVRFTASPVLDDVGRPIGTVIEARNIAQEKVAERDREAAYEQLRELNETLEERVQAEVAERAKAEEALRQAQKMEAVGQLTGGIAHDFNNLLTVVTGNIDMANRALASAGPVDARAQRALDSAFKGAERAAALTQRLLAFSRRQPLAPKPLDVDKLVVGMSDLLNRALGETVELEIVTSPGLWRVEADPNQLESAILNLAVNARDAMPRGGQLTVETANARLDDAYTAQHAEVAPGQYVVIAVTDTGTGMSKDTVSRVFEPFFTTKEVGKGTGLGLSMVYGFVKQSGGHVKIYSEEGHGTTVKLYLPRLFNEGAAVDEPTLTQGIEVSQRRETVLVVEDDDDVRAYTVECLRELGYRVLEAHDGPSALRLQERQGEPIDLLFTDVVMPGMSGRELADAARERTPELKVLYTSGYTRNAIMHGGRLDPGIDMIAKPFTYQALAQKVRDVLDRGQTGRVLVVESDPNLRAMTAEALVASGYVTDEAATALEALAKVRSAQGLFDLLVINWALSDHEGGWLLAELRSLHADLPVLIAVSSDPQGLAKRFASDRCVAVLEGRLSSAGLRTELHRLGVECPHVKRSGADAPNSVRC